MILQISSSTTSSSTTNSTKSITGIIFTANLINRIDSSYFKYDFTLPV